MSRRMIASRLTPVGRGAVATIRLVGSFSNAADDPINSLFHAANGISLSHQPLGKIAFGEWGRADAEELVVCRLDQTTIEIHCHGGEAAVKRILADLSDAGCEIVEWNQSTVIAQDLLEVECLDVLSRTSTWRTTRIALEQSQGLLKSAFQQLQKIEFENHQRFQEAVDQLLKWSHFGLHLSQPWNVVLTGRPNVGKSSLINALLGYQRAIVFDQPGTTRDVVTGETAFEGWPVLFADTAGIRDDASPLEAAGIALARQQLASADLSLVLIDLSQPPTEEDIRLIAQWPQSLLIAHKCDLPDRWGEKKPDTAISVSSVTGHGLKELQQQIIQRLIPEVPTSGTPIVLTQRQIDRLTEAQHANTIDDRLRALKALIKGDRQGEDSGPAPFISSSKRV